MKLQPEAWRQHLSGWVRMILVGITALMIATVSWQVISRFVLQEPSSVTEELARFLLIWLALLGGAQAYGERRHVALEGLVDRASKRFGPQLARGLALLSPLAVLLFGTSVLIFGGARLTAMVVELEQQAPVSQIPMGLVYLMMPIAGLVWTSYAGLEIVQRWQASNRQRPSR